MDMTETEETTVTKDIKLVDLVLIITSIICLIPIVFGIINWNSLPDEMAINFEFNGTPNTYAHKAVAVIVIPLFILAANIVMNVLFNRSSRQLGSRYILTEVFKWFFPLIGTLIAATTYADALHVSLGNVSWVNVTMGVLFILLGTCLPFTPVELVNIPVNEEAYHKWKKITGIAYIILGVIAFSAAFTEIAIAVLIGVSIPFTIATVLFVVMISR